MEPERTDRLIQLKPTGLWIDPRSIAVVHAYAFLQHRTGNKATLHIETRAGEVHKIPCKDIKDAEQRRDAIAAIANHRGRTVVKRNGVDYTGVPMPGDPHYVHPEGRN